VSVAAGNRVERSARHHKEERSGLKSSRSAFQRDRDRLVHTSALRRLAGVTQVVGPTEGHVFHNRLTHTLKVAQITRRLAERLARSRKRAASWGGIDAECAEAAALAHDLGHPPFGHIAEHELDRLVRLYGDPDGYEGNAQSFRIVTKLASHRESHSGLNLTRATLNAILKYPWLRRLEDHDAKEHRKYGAYRSEGLDFQFAREGQEARRQSVEAAIMDVADSIAYSVHDLDDFFRAGLVPLYLLRFSGDELDGFLKAWASSLKKDSDLRESDVLSEGARTIFMRLLTWWPTDRLFVGTPTQRRSLRGVSSQLINRFVSAVSLNAPGDLESPISLDHDLRVELAFLQRLVRHYVIDNPRLATQQAGQRQIVRTLFHTYARAAMMGESSIVPSAYADEMTSIKHENESQRKPRAARLAADIVSSFTDSQAQTLYRRFSGIHTGLITDTIE